MNKLSLILIAGLLSTSGYAAVGRSTSANTSGVAASSSNATNTQQIETQNIPRTGNTSESVNSQVNAQFGGGPLPITSDAQTLPSSGTTNPVNNQGVRAPGSTPLSSPVPPQPGSP